MSGSLARGRHRPGRVVEGAPRRSAGWRVIGATLVAAWLAAGLLARTAADARQPSPAPPAANPERERQGHHHRHPQEAADGDVGAGDDATVKHSFDDVAHWVAVFDDPARDEWQKPREVVAALELRPGMTVADVGAGTGYFSRHLSAAVGAGGSVLAADTEPELVAYLRERAEREGTSNLVPILASPENPRLPAAGSDLVLIVDTFHHIDDRVGYARNLKQTLRPRGRVAIVDWRDRDLPVGPDRAHKLAREKVVAEMTAAGYRLAGEPDILPYQYFLIFEPAAG